jgi:hypothetical protein
MSTDQTTDETSIFDEWVILELMGHRRLAGRLREQEIAGDGFLRLDVFPGQAKEPSATQFYRPGAVYCITPTTERIARQVAEGTDPGPVTRWELRELEPAKADPEPYEKFEREQFAKAGALADEFGDEDD